jgi:hypothetical protein
VRSQKFCCLSSGSFTYLASNVVKTLSSKFKAAVGSVQLTKVAFEKLDNAIDADLREMWTKLEKKALESRGEYLKIYDVQLEKGRS